MKLFRNIFLLLCLAGVTVSTFGFTPGITKKLEELTDDDIYRTYERISLIYSGNGPCTPVYAYQYRDPLGNPIFGRTFDNAADFVNGLAAVQSDGKWMFINNKGEVQLTTNYHYLGPLYDNLAVAATDSLFGYVNAEGRIIIKPKYVRAWNFSDGYAWVYRNNKFFVIDTSGNEISVDSVPIKYVPGEFRNGLALINTDNESIVIDTCGNIKYRTERYGIREFSNGLAFCKTAEGCGYVDTDFNWAIPQSLGLDDGKDFSINGVAPASVKGKWGLIDRGGKFILNPEYDDITQYMETSGFGEKIGNARYWLVEKDRKRGIFDSYKKKLIVPIIYTRINSFSVGYAETMVETGDSIERKTWDNKSELIPVEKYGALGPGLMMLFPPEYDRIESNYYSTNYFIVKKDGKQGLLNKEGKEIAPPVYRYIDLFNMRELPYRIAVTFDDGKKGYIDKSGKVLLRSAYKDASSIKTPEDYSVVWNDYEKKGMINSRFELVVPLEYYSLKETKGGIIASKTINGDRRYGYIDYEGNIIIPLDYCSMDETEGEIIVASKIIDGVKRYGYLDHDGNVIIPFKFGYASGFEDGKAVVKFPGKEEYQHINSKGEIVR